MEAKDRLLKLLAERLSKTDYDEAEELLDEVESDVYDRATQS